MGTDALILCGSVLGRRQQSNKLNPRAGAVGSPAHMGSSATTTTTASREFNGSSNVAGGGPSAELPSSSHHPSSSQFNNAGNYRGSTNSSYAQPRDISLPAPPPPPPQPIPYNPVQSQSSPPGVRTFASPAILQHEMRVGVLRILPTRSQ